MDGDEKPCDNGGEVRLMTHYSTITSAGHQKGYCRGLYLP